MTDNEATRTTFVRTRPALHEAEDRCYEAEAEAENFALEVTLVSRTGRKLPLERFSQNMP